MADRIALVDDDQNILTSVSLTLESEGFEVDCYHDGEAALVGLARRGRQASVCLTSRCRAWMVSNSCKKYAVNHICQFF